MYSPVIINQLPVADKNNLMYFENNRDFVGSHCKYQMVCCLILTKAQRFM